MNERIQQLEKQSYTEAMHELGGTYMAFDKEKFAELIVRECIQAVDNVGGYNEEFHMNAIKEHFGFEE
jgi:hypothetical protein